ncbi:unnamed protein product [Rhodiola kirilowii]
MINPDVGLDRVVFVQLCRTFFQPSFIDSSRVSDHHRRRFRFELCRRGYVMSYSAQVSYGITDGRTNWT